MCRHNKNPLVLNRCRARRDDKRKCSTRLSLFIYFPFLCALHSQNRRPSFIVGVYSKLKRLIFPHPSPLRSHASNTEMFSNADTSTHISISRDIRKLKQCQAASWCTHFSRFCFLERSNEKTTNSVFK